MQLCYGWPIIPGTAFYLLTADWSKSWWPTCTGDCSHVQNRPGQVWGHRTQLDPEVCHGLIWFVFRPVYIKMAFLLWRLSCEMIVIMFLLWGKRGKVVSYFDKKEVTFYVQPLWCVIMMQTRCYICVSWLCCNFYLWSNVEIVMCHKHRPSHESWPWCL